MDKLLAASRKRLKQANKGTLPEDKQQKNAPPFWIETISGKICEP